MIKYIKPGHFLLTWLATILIQKPFVIIFVHGEICLLERTKIWHSIDEYVIVLIKRSMFFLFLRLILECLIFNFYFTSQRFSLNTWESYKRQGLYVIPWANKIFKVCFLTFKYTYNQTQTRLFHIICAKYKNDSL